MTVKDGPIMERIDAGERFGKGDAIRVRLKRTQKYNNVYHAYENKSFRILEVKELIKAPAQPGLFDDTP